MDGDEFCGHLLSRTLNLCSMYRRGPEGMPEKCWDKEYFKITGQHCPNNTVMRRPGVHVKPARVKPAVDLERDYLKDLEQYNDLYPESDRLFDPEDLETVETYDSEEAS